RNGAPLTTGLNAGALPVGFLARQTSFSLLPFRSSWSFVPSRGKALQPLAWRQLPKPLQAPGVQRSLPLPQALPAGSAVQVGEQQSPALVLPSSHVSPASLWKFPQTGGRGQFTGWNTPPLPVKANVSIAPWPSTSPKKPLSDFAIAR